MRSRTIAGLYVCVTFGLSDAAYLRAQTKPTVRTETTCRQSPLGTSVRCTSTESEVRPYYGRGVGGALLAGFAGALEGWEKAGQEAEQKRRDAAMAQAQEEIAAASIAAATREAERSRMLEAAERERIAAASRLFSRRANEVRRAFADSLVLSERRYKAFSDSSSVILSDLFVADPSASSSRIADELRPILQLFQRQSRAFEKTAADVIGRVMRDKEPFRSEAEVTEILREIGTLEDRPVWGIGSGSLDYAVEAVLSRHLAARSENEILCRAGADFCNQAMLSPRERVLFLATLKKRQSVDRARDAEEKNRQSVDRARDAEESARLAARERSRTARVQVLRSSLFAAIDSQVPLELKGKPDWGPHQNALVMAQVRSRAESVSVDSLEKVNAKQIISQVLNAVASAREACVSGQMCDRAVVSQPIRLIADSIATRIRFVRDSTRLAIEAAEAPKRRHPEAVRLPQVLSGVLAVADTQLTFRTGISAGKLTSGVHSKLAKSRVSGTGVNQVMLDWRFYNGGGGDNENIEHVIVLLDATSGAWESVRIGTASVVKFAGLRKTSLECVSAERIGSMVTRSEGNGQGRWTNTEYRISEPDVPWPVIALAAMLLPPAVGSYAMNSGGVVLQASANNVKLVGKGQELFNFDTENGQIKAHKRGLFSTSSRLFGSLQKRDDDRFDGTWDDDPLRSCIKP